MNDIVKGIKEATGKDIGVEYIDNPYESAYQPFTLACMDKARREMGFIPKVGINEGISRMAEEMKKAPSF
jgi:nucleoside-diphosphate-sugar epimerase